MKSWSISSFIPILWLVTFTLAEPPVDDGYPSARSSHNDHHQDHHASEHQRSLSQEYGPPSNADESARSATSDGYDYNAPNSRASSNARGRSRFPPATVRVSFNQRFSSASSRNSGKAAARSNLQKQSDNRGNYQNGAPASRSVSEEYGIPSIMSARTLSTEYGMPDARSAPSQEYGAPIAVARNGNSKSPSEEYGVPVVATRSNQKQNSVYKFRSNQPSRSHDHTTPAARTQASNSASYPSARSNEASQGYEDSKPTYNARNAPSTTYGAPSTQPQDNSSARNFESKTDGAFNESEVSEAYGAPNARGLSQEYGAPSSRSNSMTDASPSSFGAASSRTAPSSSYLPASRSATPSEQYGTPEQRDNAGREYDYANRARALEEELRNQEPASYDFGYQIEDKESGSDFGHTETREADKAQGSYFVVRPDGSKQTVEYEADERGFKPRISVEPADAAARSGGYDDNAQDLGRADDGHSGPY